KTSKGAESRIGHKIAMEARRRGLLLRPLGHIIVIMPPLSTNLPTLTRMVSIMADAIRSVTEGLDTNM
ncbi:hypothetical protein, partial [Petrachloros mirabilis]